MLYQERGVLQAGWNDAREKTVKRWLAVLLVLSFLFGTLDGRCAEYYIDYFATLRVPSFRTSEDADAGQALAYTVAECTDREIAKAMESAVTAKEQGERNAAAVSVKTERSEMRQEEIWMQTPPDSVMPETGTGGEHIGTGENDAVLPEDGAGTETGEGSQPEDIENSTIRGFQIDENGMICSYDPERGDVQHGRLELPAENCVGIRREAFANVGIGIEELYIPQNITQIEPGALSHLRDLSWIETEASNTAYRSVDGILTDVSGAEICAFPPARTGSYALPDYIKRIADCAFEQTALSKLDLRGCTMLTVGGTIFGQTMGAGIQLIVPEELRAYYEQVFSGYSVTFNPVSEV